MGTVAGEIGAASQAGVRSPAVWSADMRVLVNTWFLFTVILSAV